MKRSIAKTLSVVLAVMLTFAVFTALPLSANAETVLNLTATSNFFTDCTTAVSSEDLEANDDFVTVVYYMLSDKNLLSADWSLTYDEDVLEYSDAYNTNDEGQLTIMPFVPGAAINTNPASASNSIIGNCTDLTLYPLSLRNGSAVPFVVVTFKVIGTGDATVDLQINDMSIARPLYDGEYTSGAEDEVQVCLNGVPNADAEDEYYTSSDAYLGGYVEPDDEAPLTVVGTSNYFPGFEAPFYNLDEYEDENGDAYIEVEFLMNAQDSYLVNLDVDEITWDPEVLEWSEEYNTYGEGQNAVLDVFPFAAEYGYGSGIIHHTDAGRLVGNYSAVSPAAYAYGENDNYITVIKLVFKVLNRTAGETIVTCNLDTLAICDESEQAPYAQNYIVRGGEVAENANELADANSMASVVAPELIIGDVNNDGVVTIDDATMIQRFLAEFLDENDNPLIDVNNDTAVMIADTNRDGKISIRDVTEIQRFLAEIIDAF